MPLPQSPALTLAKHGVLDTTVAGPVNRADVGDKVNYTLTAANVGNVTLTGVVVSDPKLGALMCVPLQPASLAPGAQMVCTGSYTLTQADLNAGQVANTATTDSGVGNRPNAGQLDGRVKQRRKRERPERRQRNGPRAVARVSARHRDDFKSLQREHGQQDGAPPTIIARGGRRGRGRRQRGHAPRKRGDQQQQRNELGGGERVPIRALGFNPEAVSAINTPPAARLSSRWPDGPSPSGAPSECPTPATTAAVLRIAET